MKEKTIPEIKAMVEKGLSKHRLVWSREIHAGAPRRWIGRCVLCNGWIAIRRGNCISQHSGDLSVYGLRFKNDRCWGAEFEAKWNRIYSNRRTYLRKLYEKGGIEAVIANIVPAKSGMEKRNRKRRK